MRNGVTSGCLVWLLTFAVLRLCLCPVAAIVGGITSSTNSGQVAALVGPYLCPAGTSAEVFTYETTLRDDDTGTYHPATGYEVHCNDAAGATVRNLGGSYAFAWVLVLLAVGLVLAAVFAVILALPAGAVMARASRGRSAPAPRA